jgi:hypothetical protein
MDWLYTAEYGDAIRAALEKEKRERAQEEISAEDLAMAGFRVEQRE